MTWKQQLADMTGKTFTRHGQPETINKCIVHDENRVEILTDADDYEMPAAAVAAFLSQFKPVAPPTTRPARRIEATAPAVAYVATVSDPSKLKLMQDALMNALARVQTDEGFIPQAEQVSKLVQTGVNLARLELDAIRLSRVQP